MAKVRALNELSAVVNWDGNKGRLLKATEAGPTSGSRKRYTREGFDGPARRMGTLPGTLKHLSSAIVLMQMIFVIGIGLGTASCGYNRLQGLDEDVKAAWAEVENQYQRRADLIPNLVNVVKGYAKHERETLQQVVEARAKATQTTVDVGDLSNAQKFEAFQKAQEQLSSALSRLMVVVERYPDLKANQNFRDLQAQLEGTENRITVARKRYIDSVSEFNKAVRYFPSNLTAKYLLGMEPKESFSASEGAKQVPQVEF